MITLIRDYANYIKVESNACFQPFNGEALCSLVNPYFLVHPKKVKTGEHLSKFCTKGV